MRTLAVFTPQLGAVSETFIRRHVDDLLPGRTVVVAAQATPGHAEQPDRTLFLDRWRRRPSVRVARRLHVPESRLRDAAVSKFLRTQAVEVVLGEYLDQFAVFVPLLDRLGIPYVVQGHGIDVSAALRRAGVAEGYMVYASAR